MNLASGHTDSGGCVLSAFSVATLQTKFRSLFQTFANADPVICRQSSFSRHRADTLKVSSRELMAIRRHREDLGAPLRAAIRLLTASIVQPYGEKKIRGVAWSARLVRLVAMITRFRSHGQDAAGLFLSLVRRQRRRRLA